MPSRAVGIRVHGIGIRRRCSRSPTRTSSSAYFIPMHPVLTRSLTSEALNCVLRGNKRPAFVGCGFPAVCVKNHTFLDSAAQCSVFSRHPAPATKRSIFIVSSHLKRPNTQIFESMRLEDLTVAFLLALGGSFGVVLTLTCLTYPLFPFQPENLDWTRAWLWTTCGDYWTLAACFSTVILYTERDLTVGLLWVAAINLLGSPCAALYLALRLRREGTISMVHIDGRSPSIYNRL
jgi:hypothetical protein